MNFTDTPAAIGILIATFGISLYTLYSNQQLLYKMMLHPYSVTNENKWYQLLTSGFVHADMSHLLFNMLSFYFFAFNLEYIIGTSNFLTIYFGSMILSDLSTVFKNKENYDYRALGASGAVSGVIFASILFNPTAKLAFLLFPIPIPAPIFGILFLAYCVYASKKSRDMINHEAHFWGAIAGIILSILLIPDVVPFFIESIF